MLKVQNELMQLKKKANETELKSLQDSKLAELEKEIHKYQNECLDIRKHCDKLTSEIKAATQKKDILLEH